MRHGTLRYEDSSATMAFVLVLGFLATAAFGLYWLMQPTVYKNYGVAALKPTTNTETLWRRRSEQTAQPPAVTTGHSNRDNEEKNAAAAKTDTGNRQAVAAPRPQYRPRPQPYPSYQGWNGFGRGGGFRPFF